MNGSRVSITMVLTLSVLTLSTAGAVIAGENDRVVVQDVRPEFLAVSRDGRFVAARGRRSKHTFQVIDIKEPAVLMVVDLPERISHAAIAPQNGSFFVSGENTIYRVDRITARYEVLLTETSGAVSLDDAGDRLGVLGKFAVDRDDDERMRPNLSSQLGVYDLIKEEWLVTTSTPILADRLVFFDGDHLVGYGRGGRIQNRRSSSFRCHVELDMSTGKSKLTRGLELDRGSRNVDEYVPPKQLEFIMEAREAAAKRLGEVRDKLSPFVDRAASLRIFHPLRRDEQVSMLVDHRHSSEFNSAVLNIRRDGTIDITPANITGVEYVHLIDGRLVETRRATHDGNAVEISSSKVVLKMPPTERNPSTHRWHQFLSRGCLYYEDGNLAWYRANVLSGPVWQTQLEQPVQNPYPILVSPHGQHLAISRYQGKSVFDLYSFETGKRVLTIPRQENVSDGYSHCANFNHSGDRLAAMIGKRLQLYEIPSGKQLRDEPIPNDEYRWHITSVGDDWIAGGDFHSNLFHSTNGWGPTIPLSNIFRASEIDCEGRESLLVENRDGLGAIVDLESGKLKAKWYIGDRQGSGGAPQMPPRAIAVFGGKLLLRHVGHAAEVELIDLATLKPLAKIHPVSVDDKQGWIISTEDGFWDASPAAEKLIAMYDGLRRLTPDEQLARRNPKLIKTRLAGIGR